MDGKEVISEQFAQSLACSMILAACLNWALLGILCSQTVVYYLAFPNDRVMAMTLVYSLLVLEIAQTSVVSHDIFIALTSPWGDDATKLNLIQNHWLSIPVFGGMSGGIGQLYFAYRIWFISGKNFRRGPAPIIVSILAIASVASAFISAEAFFDATTFSQLLDGDSGFAAIGTWNGIGAICDITIALVMPYFIMRHGTGMPPTHVMIVKIVRLILETGMFTAVIAILHMCLYFANSQAFIVPGLCLSKVYANTLLVLLNSRVKLVDGRADNNAQEESFEIRAEFGDRNIRSTYNEQPPSPSKSVTRKAGGLRSSTSTVFVSNDRLLFRLGDMPPSPNRSQGIPIAVQAAHLGQSRRSSAQESVGTKSDASIRTIQLKPILPYSHLSINSKV